MNPTPRRTLPALLLAAFAVACGPGTENAPLVLNGRIEAPTVDLAPKVAGRVREVRVREGDRVRTGDLLVTLDLGETAVAVERDRAALSTAKARLRDYEAGNRKAEIRAAEAEVAERRAALDLALREEERQKRLLDEQVSPERDHDLARTERERAQASLRASEERLGLLREGFRTWQTEQARFEVDRAGLVLRQSEISAAEFEIRAPANAVVLHRIAEPGLLLAPGQSAMTLAFSDRLYVRTFVPEAKLGRVRPGLKATVRVDAYPDRSFPARITEISPQAEFTPKPVETREERVNLVYAAKADLDAGWNEPLVPGQPAEVTVADDESSASH